MTIIFFRIHEDLVEIREELIRISNAEKQVE
jgi:hypothetical protein